MFDSLRRSVGILSSRFTFRKAKDTIITFTDPIAASAHVLVVLPFDMPDDASDHHDLLRTIARRFDQESITVVTPGAQFKIERVVPHARVIHIGPEEISRWFTPRGDGISQIRARRFDLAVDLNLDNILPSGYICKASGARIRVGFASPHADLFYNLQVRLNPSSQRRHAYERLLECLRMFFPDEAV
jgi:hypothetical protein